MKKAESARPIIFQKGLSFLELAALIIRSGKLNEFFSFFIWEILRRIGWYERVSVDQSQCVQLDKYVDDSYIHTTTHFSIHKEETDWVKIVPFLEGNLAVSASDESTLLYIKEGDNDSFKSINFSAKITNIYVTINEDALISSQGKVYILEKTWKAVQVLSLTHESSTFLDEAVVEDQFGNILIGEYGNHVENGRFVFMGILYTSRDLRNWSKNDFLFHKGVNKHIHCIKFWGDNELILTDGDNLKQLWLGKLDYEDGIIQDISWINKTARHIHMGGYTGAFVSKLGVTFGTDYHGGVNFIVKSSDMKKFKKKVLPSRMVRSVCQKIDLLKSEKKDDWAMVTNFYNGVHKNNQNIAMISRDDGENWTELFSYYPKDYYVRIASACSPFRTVFTVKDKKKNKFYNLILQLNQ